MVDWALSTNLYTFAQVEQGFFAWPVSGAEAEQIRTMQPGDFIVPKFARSGAYRQEADAGDAAQLAYVTQIDGDYDRIAERYTSTVRDGEAAVPFVLQVIGQRDDDTRSEGPAWAGVLVQRIELPVPLSNKDFLRLRVVPPQVAAQFKATVSSGRHLQQLPTGAAKEIQAAGQNADRGDRLRQYSLVRASTLDELRDSLVAAGRDPSVGDRALGVAPGGIPGVVEATSVGLKFISKPIPMPAESLLELFQEAKRKSREEDAFTPQNAIAAASELQSLLAGAEDVLPIDDFARWHDRYELLSQKVTQATAIATRPEPQDTAPSAEPTSIDDEELPEVDEELSLAGLTIEAVRAELPDGMAFPDSVIAEAVTALRSGKHLLLGGPPGTGKSTLAEALARAVMGNGYDVTTATADWTTFDTIGGYLPDPTGGIRFVPGVVLRALRSGRWLLIDELNRADIDKAFGPLFTLLGGGDSGAARSASLPYQDVAGQPVTIGWAARRKDLGGYVITPSWRILGTLNLADKASLFQLSFAFLRRFAVVDVPLPSPGDYRVLLERLFAGVPDPDRALLVSAAEQVAFGSRQIGPAILVDVASFVSKALSPVGGGSGTYDDSVEAFLVAVRLLVVPQYEGAEASQGTKLVNALHDALGDRSEESWAPLKSALASVELQ